MTDKNQIFSAKNGGARLCWHIRPFASGWIDGSLGALPRHLVGAHIARCRACQKALADLKSLTERLRALPARRETLGDDRWAILDAALTEAERRRENSPPR